MTDDRLYDLCQQMLAVCVDALTGESVGGVALLPDVTVIQHGPGWAWDDCERLVVHPDLVAGVQPVGAVTTGQSQAPPVGPGPVRPTATVVATLLYCIPKIGDDEATVPPAATITAASERLHKAALTMWRGVARGQVDGTIGDGCGGVTVGPMTPTGARGGYAGWRLPVLADLTGITYGS